MLSDEKSGSQQQGDNPPGQEYARRRTIADGSMSAYGIERRE
jgi:hypothetical protein